MVNKVVLIDRDGVINRDCPDSVCSIDDFVLIPGAAQAIAQLCSLGFRVLVITNQACIGRGATDMKTVEMIHRKMCLDIRQAGGEITDIFICPHTPDDRCTCRKPLPGLIIQAHEKYHFVMGQTWFVGDAVRDIEAAQIAGCRPALVLTGLGATSAGEIEDIPVFRDLLAFSNFLSNQDSRFPS